MSHCTKVRLEITDLQAIIAALHDVFGDRVEVYAAPQRRRIAASQGDHDVVAFVPCNSAPMLRWGGVGVQVGEDGAIPLLTDAYDRMVVPAVAQVIDPVADAANHRVGRNFRDLGGIIADLLEEGYPLSQAIAEAYALYRPPVRDTSAMTVLALAAIADLRALPPEYREQARKDEGEPAAVSPPPPPETGLRRRGRSGL